MSDSDDDLDGERLLRALEVLDAWESAGRAQAVDEVLAAHPDLADLLAPMLEEPSRMAAPSRATGAQTRAQLGQLPRIELSERYELGELVGRGGMGTVHRVVDPSLGRELALKQSRHRLEPGSREGDVGLRLAARFLEEAQITGQLDHPGVVPLHELALDEEGQPYFTMKLVRGVTLGEVLGRLRRGEDDWTLARVLGLVQRVCETMAFAHERGVIHRDLKPDNVMVGAHGEVYVMDWGLARVLGRDNEEDALPAVLTDRSRERDLETGSPLQTVDGTLIGTPAYMSPEQARGELSRLDERADVYAVGCLLYELLVGRAPHVEADGSTDGYALLQRVRSGESPDLEAATAGAPAELQAICAKAMAPEADARYASMVALRDDLRAYLEGRVVSAHRTGALAELRTWVRRNRALAGALAAVFLVLVLGVLGTGLGLLREQEANERQRRTAYHQAISMALAAIERGQGRLAQELLDDTPEDLRGWEWRHLAGSLDAGRQLATYGFDIRVAEFLADSRRFVVATWGGDVELRDLEDGLLARHEVALGGITRGSVAPESARLFMIDHTVRERLVALDVESGELAWDVTLAGPNRALLVDREEKHVFVVSQDPESYIDSRLACLDAATGEEVWQTRDLPFGGSLHGLGWDAEGHLVVLAQNDAVVLELPSLRVLGRLKEPHSRAGDESFMHAHNQVLWPERNVLLCANSSGVDLYSLPGLELVERVSIGGESAGRVIGDRDGRTLHWSRGSELRSYDLSLHREIGRRHSRAQAQRILSRSPDGLHLLCAQSHWSPLSASRRESAKPLLSTLRVWSTRAAWGLKVPGLRPGLVASRRWRLIEPMWGEVRVTDLSTGEPVARYLTAGTSPAPRVGLAHDERHLVMTQEIGNLALEVLDLETGEPLAGLSSEAGRYGLMATDPSAPRFVAQNKDKALELRSSEDMSLLGVFEEPGRDLTALSVTRLGRWLITGDTSGRVSKWSMEALDTRLVELDLGSSWILNVADSPGGDLVALGTEDGRLVMAELETLHPIGEVRVDGPISSLAWNPGGDRLAAFVSGDVLLYEPRTLDLVFSSRHGSETRGKVSWDASGERLVASTSDAGLTVFETALPTADLALTRDAVRRARLAAQVASGTQRSLAEAEQELEAMNLDGSTLERARRWLPRVGPVANRLRDKAIWLGQREGADAATRARAIEFALGALERSPERPRYRATALGLLLAQGELEQVVERSGPELLRTPTGAWSEDTPMILTCQAQRIEALAKLGESERARAELGRLESWHDAASGRWRGTFDELLAASRALVD